MTTPSMAATVRSSQSSAITRTTAAKMETAMIVCRLAGSMPALRLQKIWRGVAGYVAAEMRPELEG